MQMTSIHICIFTTPHLQPHKVLDERNLYRFSEANVFIEIMDRRSKTKIFDNMLEEIQMLLGFFELVNFYWNTKVGIFHDYVFYEQFYLNADICCKYLFYL